MKRLVAICAGLIGIAVLCAVSMGWVLAHPVQTRIGSPPADLNAQVVTFASDSGANVHGWWCPLQNRRGVVLLLPGIRANRLSMLDRARFLRRGVIRSYSLISRQPAKRKAITSRLAGKKVAMYWPRQILPGKSIQRRAWRLLAVHWEA